ncbi:MAG: APC family permease [Gemmatimonadales bacterium]
MASETGLIRSIGRWALAGLILNSILGSGVYGLPSLVAGKLGSLAWVGVLLAGVVVATIVACFAEVASRFPGTGGPYLYTRAAFGPYLGVQVGWMHYLTRLASAATNLNLFVIYLGEFLPGVTGLGPKLVTIVVVLALLTLVNIRGVKHGAAINSASIVIKVVPLVAFGVAGLALVLVKGPVEPVITTSPTAWSWVEALLILVFAYGGFESGVIALGEAKDPARDAPFALFVAIGTCLVIYTLVQLVTSLSVADPASYPRSVAEAARYLVGPVGAVVMTLGALLSLFGWFVGAMVSSPRLTFAMAEQGVLPRAFAWIHPQYRTPAVSIVAFAVISLVLAMSGGFLANLTLSVISRLFIYGSVCLSLPVFRRRDGRDPALAPARFRLPAGPAFAAVGIVITVMLATRMSAREALVMAIVVALASVNWWFARQRGRLAG